MPDIAPRRRVVFVAFPDVQALDVTGPSEVFSLAERLSGASYPLELVASQPGPLACSSGLRLVAGRAPAQTRSRIDTLVVAGGLGVSEAERDERLISWLRLAAARSRRVASVCTGAFLLARAGLLEGRRATTHWAACRALQRRNPDVQVETEPIFVRDGNVYTSAGVTAGIDLALALIEEDLGSRAALEIARALVLFVRRPGGQRQFSTSLAGQTAERSSLRELQQWIGDHLGEDLSVPALAGRAFMSERNFARVFRREVGISPASYVESLRVERAKLLLQSTPLSVQEVGQRCGFGTVETLRRSFARAVGASPADYRSRFQASPPAEVIPLRRAG
jgi:transcriptional regulator GlxA family with amidase domain